MNIVFRTDASLTIGTGHVMRCLALADKLKAKECNVTFVCRDLAGNLCSLIEEKGYAVFKLYGLPDGEMLNWRDDAAGTARCIDNVGGQADWVIVDQYQLDARWESLLRRYARGIMAIDDLADRPHEVDILLDQNLQLPAGRYEGLLPASCLRLMGPTFALLRREFSEARTTVQPRHGGVQRVLVFIGGGDVRNVTGKVLDALTCPEMAHLTLDIVLIKGSPYYGEIQSRCDGLRNCTLYVQTTEMADLMAKADLMIGGSGSATWERCCLGLPAVLISIAENQRVLGRAASSRRAAIYLGDDEGVSVENLRSLLIRVLGRPGLLRRIGSRASALVDGRGTCRVVAALVRRLRVTVVSDQDSWINEYLVGLTEAWRTDGHMVTWVHKTEEIERGDCAFFLSFSRIASAEALSRNTHNLVVHESDLPRGRGWSPLTWQILEGVNRIPVTLFEAEASVDSGVIYGQAVIEFDGDELIDELRHKQGSTTVELCRRFLADYPAVIASGRPQIGDASYYPRRRARDSRLDPSRSIAEQFQLLRVVDNRRYPAWFEWAGNKYIVHIQKADKYEM